MFLTLLSRDANNEIKYIYIKPGDNINSLFYMHNQRFSSFYESRYVCIDELLSNV